MPFTLSSVVPWGRNIEEYISMFRLTGGDMEKQIAGFGDGPASFNAQATAQGFSVTSFDIIYRFSKDEIERRIEETRSVVMRQTRENMDNYVWTNIKTPEELETTRMSAMRLFLDDYERGRREGRYIFHEFPNRLDVSDNTFDIGLSSHFLMMYTSLGYDFHVKTITEMMRVCREVRIFPIVDLDANKTALIADVIDYFKNVYSVEILDTDYKFQKGENKMLRISQA